MRQRPLHHAQAIRVGRRGNVESDDAGYSAHSITIAIRGDRFPPRKCTPTPTRRHSIPKPVVKARPGFNAEASGAIEAYPRSMGTANTPKSAPLSDVARVAAEDFRRGRESVISAALARELATAIELALLTAVRAERRACAAECTRRGELWQRTADQPETAAPIKAEADHRANEALYLGDLIATRGG
jgi:hypothetical protein